MAKTRTTRRTRATPARARSKPASRSRKVEPVPPQYGTVTPYLTVSECGAAIDFYKRAFGAKEMVRMPGPEGRVMHAEVKIGDSIVMVSDEFPEQGARSPKSLGGTSASVVLYVKDCDRVYRQALDSGARSLQEPQDMFWGDRFCRVEDPYGHLWGIGTAKEKVSPKEMARRMAAMGPPGEGQG